MDNYTISIPSKKYIRKYFTSLYGDIIKPTINDDFGDSILTKLSSQPLSRINNSKKNIFLLGLDDSIKFKIPIDYFYRIQNKVTDEHIHTINRYLSRRFDDDLFIFVNICTAFGIERKKAIEAFCSRFNLLIDQDTTIESLQKKELRIREQPDPSKEFLVTFGSQFHSYVLGGYATA